MVSTTQYDQADGNVFDYVIVGGGTAGLVLAARLTEDPAVHVVVLEAGESRLEDSRINIPGLMSTLYGDKNYDWYFKTTPQPGLNGRIIHWPRGKALGGSSAINFLMASHASRVDLDNWEKLGNPGWNFDALQPYYRKSETYNPPSEEVAKSLQTNIIDPVLHGSHGPLQTNFPAGTGALDSAWPHAFTALGLGAVGDPRDGTTLGGYNLTKYMDSAAKRSYAAPAYYAPNAERANLTVLTNAFVHKIESEVKEVGVVATGVKYSVNGKEHFVKTRGEIIVSAGTIQSPQILELSGIGSKAHLEKLGVEVVVANPNVGENLQDHPIVNIAYEALDGIPTAEMIKQPGVLDWALQEWTQKGAGPLAAGVTGTSFLSHSSVVPAAQLENLRAHTLDLLEEATVPSQPGLQKQYQLQKEVLLNDQEADVQFNFGASGLNPESGEDVSKFFTHDDEGGYAGIPTALTHAFSRGSVHIQSSDPAVHPTIDPRYMSHPIDLEIFSNGLLFTQTIAGATPLADLLKDNDAGDGKRIQPSFKVKGRLTKERAVELVKEATGTSFHPVGTCSMLPEEDGGVVDSRLRVYGVSNLRVVDASVAPLNVRGNIASMVYAVAERAADLIKEDRKV